MTPLDAIRAELERQGRTRHWLARQAGIRPQHIYKILPRDGQPRVDPRYGTLCKMLDALDLDSGDMLCKSAGTSD